MAEATSKALSNRQRYSHRGTGVVCVIVLFVLHKGERSASMTMAAHSFSRHPFDIGCKPAHVTAHETLSRRCVDTTNQNPSKLLPSLSFFICHLYILILIVS
jgi:hypothetical protein